MKRIAVLILLIVVGWLTLLPVDIAPVAWQSPDPDQRANHPSARVLAEAEALAPMQRLMTDLAGPEALIIEANADVIAGLADGRIVRFNLNQPQWQELANTGGRPLGLARHPDGRLIIADAKLGLLSLAANGTLRVLTNSADGQGFGFTDDVVIDAEGRYAYFTDASSRWGYGHDDLAILEHGGDGRLLRYDFSTGSTETLLNNLEFANGVALSADESFVLVCETGAYRVTRYFLSGGRINSTDTFIDNLPGFPDNIRLGQDGRFWLALFAPRNPLLDWLDSSPSLRTMMARALIVLPKPVAHRAMVLQLSPEGLVERNLQNDDGGSYAPITTAVEFSGALYLGSLSQQGIGRWSITPQGPAKPAESN